MAPETREGFQEPGVVTPADDSSGNVLIGYGTGGPGPVASVPAASVPAARPVPDAARAAPAAAARRALRSNPLRSPRAPCA